jgi:hypothetical protein
LGSVSAKRVSNFFFFNFIPTQIITYIYEYIHIHHMSKGRSDKCYTRKVWNASKWTDLFLHVLFHMLRSAQLKLGTPLQSEPSSDD